MNQANDNAAFAPQRTTPYTAFTKLNVIFCLHRFHFPRYGYRACLPKGGRNILRISALAAAIIGLSISAQAARPNIIYILADDMGPGDVTCYNAEGKIPTPHIDRLAHEGIKFMDAHSNSGVCTPTRYGILTGRYAWRSRLKSNVINGHARHLIEPTRETVASLLKRQGYATACVGKWHLGMDWKLKTERGAGDRIKWKDVEPKAPITNGPNSLGFDYFFGLSGSLNMDPHAYVENDRLLGDLITLKTREAATAHGFTQPSYSGYASTDYVQQEVLSTFTQKATGWIRENQDKPFFLYFPLPSPHSPLVPSEPFKGKSGLNLHGDFCLETDWVVGEVLKTREAATAHGFTQPSYSGYASTDYVQQEVLSTFTQKATGWIRENKDKPFFLYFPLPSPHSPLVPSEPFKGKSGLNLHGDFCLETDWVVGEVLKTLDELGLTENTLVVFTADNGTSPRAEFEELAAKGHHPSWIYRGMKGTNWEGGHRVPFVVRWPIGIKAGTQSDVLSCTTDFLATCADLLGEELADNAGEDSVSFLPALKGKPVSDVENRLVIHHSDKGVFSIRRGKWKVMFDGFGGSGRYDPRANEPIKNMASLQLYDMETDAVENINVAAQHPEVVEMLKKELAEIVKKGRSTAGKSLPTDYNDPAVKWPQLEPIREFL